MIKNFSILVQHQEHAAIVRKALADLQRTLENIETDDVEWEELSNGTRKTHSFNRKDLINSISIMVNSTIVHNNW